MATIFITGATGVLGRGTVARLLDDGHRVRALARNADRVAAIERLRVEPVVADIYDLESMIRALAGADVAMHLATRIPPVVQARRPSAWAENTKLRAVGTKVLVDAALAAGVGRVVAESITFLYRDGGSEWLDEQSPVDPGDALQSVVTLEDETARFTAQSSGGGGIVLRFGSFYGADARSTDEYLKAAQRRLAPVLGPPDGYVSSIHTRDAAAATVAALSAPAGTYNVVDDVPLTRREYADGFAHAFGLRRLRIVGPSVVRVAGGRTAQVLVRSQRVRNVAFRGATGWAPEVASAVDGWAEIAAARNEASHA